MRTCAFIIGAAALILFADSSAHAGSMSKAGRSVGNKQSSSRSKSSSSRSSSRNRNSNDRPPTYRRSNDAYSRTRVNQNYSRRYRNRAYGGPLLWGGLVYPGPYYYGYRNRHCFNCPTYPTKSHRSVQTQLMSKIQLDVSIQSNKNDDTETSNAYGTHMTFGLSGPFVGIRFNADKYYETVTTSFEKTNSTLNEDDLFYSETNNIALWGGSITGRVLQAPQYAIELDLGLAGMTSNLFDSMVGPKLGGTLKVKPSRNVEILARYGRTFFDATETNTGENITIDETELSIRMSYFKVAYRRAHFNFSEQDDIKFTKDGPEVGLSFEF